MEQKGLLQEEAFRTPVSLIWDQVLMIPIVGIMDSLRTQKILSLALNMIQETKARFLIVDISGVGIMDQVVASHLVKITRAARLMGCECVLTGVVPEIARTIVEAGIDLGDIKTHPTLRDGLEAAFKHLGLVVTRSER